MSRREEIEAGLVAVRERIDAATRAAGRDPATVTLVVVTKFFPASDVRILADLGVREVGENRHQEAEEKAAELADLDLVWHFIGNLQSNKAAAVARYAAVVESVDRRKLLSGLARGAQERHGAVGSGLDVLVQVDLDPQQSAKGRGGATPDDVPALCDAVAETEGIDLRGLMAVAPLDGDPGPAFARLGDLHRDVLRDHPGAERLSAGMSGDLEPAIAAGRDTRACRQRGAR